MRPLVIWRKTGYNQFDVVHDDIRTSKQLCQSGSVPNLQFGAGHIEAKWFDKDRKLIYFQNHLPKAKSPNLPH